MDNAEYESEEDSSTKNIIQNLIKELKLNEPQKEE